MGLIWLPAARGALAWQEYEGAARFAVLLRVVEPRELSIDDLSKLIWKRIGYLRDRKYMLREAPL